MTQRRYLEKFQIFLYLFWTSGSVLSQEVSNNNPNKGSNGSNEERTGSLYFFYQQPAYPRDCAEARNHCSSDILSSVNVIKPDGYREPFEVSCDFSVDSTGWTVIYRRQDSSVLFNRTWREYQNGFGFLSQELWIGNEKLAFLTNQNSYELRIDFTITDGSTFYVTYNKFRISDEYGEYKLASVGEYNGASGNITSYLCPTVSDEIVYVSPDCSKRCSCNSGQFLCDDYVCSPNAVCQSRNNVLQCYCKAGYVGNGTSCNLDVPPSDCKDVYDRISAESGVYTIKPTTWTGDPFRVYCNMSDGGGWTVFQRRFDGSQNFHLYWSDYKHGFGTVDGELWLGNEKLHSLTTQKSYRLRIDVVNQLGDPYYAMYSSISINDETDNYRMTLGSYSGNAGNTIGSNSGQPFTTRDRDNDDWSRNCAIDNSGYCSSCSLSGGWWHRCTSVTVYINGYYGECVILNSLPGSICNIGYTEMKIQPI